MSPLGRTTGARIPTWMEVLRIRPYIGFRLLLRGRCGESGVVKYLFVGKVEERAVVNAAVVEDVLV